MNKLSELANRGVNLEEAMDRFMNNEQMYVKYIMQLPKDNTYTVLVQSLNEQNIQEAFEAAHRLKGITANLAMWKINEKLKLVVDNLKKGIMPEETQWLAFDTEYQEMMTFIQQENNL